MKKLLEKEDLLKPAKIGDIVEGKVISKESGRLFLDLGPIGTGIIYGREFLEAKEKIKDLKIDDNIVAKIIGIDEDEGGYIELSITQAGREVALATLKQKKDKGEKISVKILSANKGGLLTKVMEIPAFLPVSQLSSKHYPKVEDKNPAKIVRQLQKFIGKELEVKILDFTKDKEQIILSEKAKELDEIKEMLKNYRIGDVVEGEISGVTSFGVFLKFNHLEGLIPISELDWKIIEDPSEIVKIGDKVQAKIIGIKGNKVFFSLKALKENPWIDIEKKYKKGEIIEGKVIKLNPFGAFIQVTPTIQGLCHISEFTTKTEMEEKLKIGEKYYFQILEIQPSKQRLSLKLIENENCYPPHS